MLRQSQWQRTKYSSMSTYRVDDVCAWARIRSCICRVATQGFHITICLRWNIQRYTPLTMLLFVFIHVRSRAFIRVSVSLLCFCIQWIFTSVILSHRKSFVAIERFSASNVFVCAHSLCVLDCMMLMLLMLMLSSCWMWDGSMDLFSFLCSLSLSHSLCRSFSFALFRYQTLC